MADYTCEDGEEVEYACVGGETIDDEQDVALQTESGDELEIEY